MCQVTDLPPRCVHFNDDIEIAEEAYYEREWYSDKECDDYKAQTLTWLKRGKKARYYQDSALFTARGYEYVTQNYSRIAMRKEHSKRVLKVKRKGEEAMAECACNSSLGNGSMRRAKALAVSDEQAAGKIYQEYPLPLGCRWIDEGKSQPQTSQSRRKGLLKKTSSRKKVKGLSKKIYKAIKGAYQKKFRYLLNCMGGPNRQLALGM